MKLTRREFLHLSTAAAVAGGVTLLPVGQAAALAAPSVQQLVEEAYLYAYPRIRAFLKKYKADQEMMVWPTDTGYPIFGRKAA